jgi:hypothetical protein
VRRALTHVNWIEQNSIKADRETTQVTFGVNDKKQFSLDALRDALPSKYQKGLAIVK